MPASLTRRQALTHTLALGGGLALPFGASAAATEILNRRRDSHLRAVITAHRINGYFNVHRGLQRSRQGYKAGVMQDKTSLKKLFAFGANDFTATVKTVGANVVAQMHFTGCWLNSQRGRRQKVMRAVHTAFRRGFFILLNSHVLLLTRKSLAPFERCQRRKR